MTHDPRSDPHSAAIEQLKAFRLSTYAARTFVALSSLGSATAKEVSQVSDVPRTRVYDAVEELHDRGLVDIQQSSPQQFMPISVETTRRKFEQEVTHQLSVLTTALSRLEPAERQVEQRGIWTVSGQTAIVDRLVEFFKEADEEIIYVATEEYFSPALIDGLSMAADRDITVKLGGLSAELLETIQTEIPTAERVVATELSPEVSRLLLVDGSKTLVSVHPQQSVTEQEPSNPATDGQGSTTTLHTETDPATNGQGSTANPTAIETANTETAIWGVGKTNSLVIILKSIFGLQAEAIQQQH